MYVDFNPGRAAMVSEPEQAVHTSVYDRLRAEQGQLIDSAAYDLVPVSTEAAGKAIRETPVAELKRQRRAKKRKPTQRRIRRDGWLSPLNAMIRRIQADGMQHHELRAMCRNRRRKLRRIHTMHKLSNITVVLAGQHECS